LVLVLRKKSRLHCLDWYVLMFTCLDTPPGLTPEYDIRHSEAWVLSLVINLPGQPLACRATRRLTT